MALYNAIIKMSNRDNLQTDDFILVNTKKNRRKSKINKHIKINEEEVDVDKEAAVRRIKTAEEELIESDIFCSLIASLREGLTQLNNPTIKEIYCLGIGHVGERIVPRYQLALLLCLKNKLNIDDIYIQDPALYPIEKEILKDLDLKIIEDNFEGKYKSDTTTIYYLPHCPKQLTNNLLWSNWGLDLTKCVIISNSFSNINDTLTKRQLINSANFISNILPYTLELAVINSFKYYDVFNDTAIHMFPLDKLSLISEDFWDNRDEPNYSTDDLEFIKNC